MVQVYKDEEGEGTQVKVTGGSGIQGRGGRGYTGKGSRWFRYTRTRREREHR